MGKKELGLTIKTMRLSRSLSQSEVAEAVGVAPSTISMYETGQREPDIDKIEALADLFNVPISALLENGASPSDVPASLQPNPVSLTPDETNLLDSYRELNAEGKAIARTTVQSLAANPDLRKDTSSETA